MGANSDTVFVLLSGFSILIALYMDLFLCIRNRSSYLTNWQHVTIYSIPMMVSFIFFMMFAIESNTIRVTIVMLNVMILIYISLLNSEKIILRSADFPDVVEKLNTFLTEKNKKFRIYKKGENIMSVELNNYKDALTVMELSQWVEIHNNIQSDDDFIKEINDYFKKNIKTLKFHKKYPNFYFAVIHVVFVVLTVLFVQFTLSH